MAKMMRTVIQIDEEKCDGCGVCVPSCAEGAIQIIDGKARLVSDVYCDGLGACLGECPQGAIALTERDAEVYDGRATEEHLREIGRDPSLPHGPASHDAPAPAARRGAHAFGCPGSRTLDFRAAPAAESCVEPEATLTSALASELRQWPVKLYLVSPNAPYFQNAELLVAADCAPLAYAAVHPDFLKGKAVVIGCPKFDDVAAYAEKLTAIFTANDIRKVQVLHMEVPCCFGLARVVRQAVAAAGVHVPVEDVTVSLRGEVSVAAAA